MPALGVSLLLLALGSIGVLVSLLFWTSFAPYGNRGDVIRRTDVVQRDVREPHDVV